MLTNIKERERKTDTWYELVFDDGRNNGFSFPCDEAGTPAKGLMQAAIDNLEYAKAHPEKFVRYNKVVKCKNTYIEPAHGTCSCGREVYLIDEYYGACSCDCGKWYNLYGQELTPPEFWENDPCEDEWF